MMKFFYDSLETLQKLNYPTKKDYIMLSIAIVVTIIIAGIFFIFTDSIFSSLYRSFYTTMRSGSDITQTQDLGSLLSGINDTSTGSDIASLSGLMTTGANK